MVLITVSPHDIIFIFKRFPITFKSTPMLNRFCAEKHGNGVLEIVYISCQEMKGTRIFPDLGDNKLVCHSFLDDSRRQNALAKGQGVITYK